MGPFGLCTDPETLEGSWDWCVTQRPAGATCPSQRDGGSRADAVLGWSLQSELLPFGLRSLLSLSPSGTGEWAPSFFLSWRQWKKQEAPVPPCWWLTAATRQPPELHLQGLGLPQGGGNRPPMPSVGWEQHPRAAPGWLPQPPSPLPIVQPPAPDSPWCAGECASAPAQLGTKYNSPVVFWARLTCSH